MQSLMLLGRSASFLASRRSRDPAEQCVKFVSMIFVEICYQCHLLLLLSPTSYEYNLHYIYLICKWLLCSNYFMMTNSLFDVRLSIRVRGGRGIAWLPRQQGLLLFSLHSGSRLGESRFKLMHYVCLSFNNQSRCISKYQYFTIFQIIENKKVAC
jgi:hypothetical protein